MPARNWLPFTELSGSVLTGLKKSISRREAFTNEKKDVIKLGYKVLVEIFSPRSKIGTVTNLIEVIPFFRDVKIIRTPYGMTVTECEIHVAINGNYFKILKDKVRYDIDDWQRLVQHLEHKVEADYQVESVDFKHEWNKNYPLSTFINKISNVHILNKDGKITKEPTYVKK